MFGGVAEWLDCDGLAILHWDFSFSYVDGDSDGSSAADECRRLCQNSFTNGRNGQPVPSVFQAQR
jgi:hypothetical protein